MLLSHSDSLESGPNGSNSSNNSSPNTTLQYIETIKSVLAKLFGEEKAAELGGR